MKNQLITPNQIKAAYLQVATGVFAKREMPLLEKAVHLSLELSLDEKYRGHTCMFVGGIAARYHVGTKFWRWVDNKKARFSDIDISFHSIPPSLAMVCDEEAMEGPKGKTHGFGTVFHLKKERRDDLPLFDDVCFFGSRVGRITCQKEDYMLAERVRMEIGTADGMPHLVEMRFADLGLVLATALTPQTITWIRARRAAIAIASNMEMLEETAARYLNIIGRNRMREEELIGPLQTLLHEGRKCAKKETDAFFSVLAKGLDAAAKAIKGTEMF